MEPVARGPRPVRGCATRRRPTRRSSPSSPCGRRATGATTTGFLQRARPELTVTPEDVEGNAIRVAVDGDHLLGFSAVDVGSAPAELLALWVDPPAIGTGVGRALLQDALVTAAGHGTGGLLVESDPNAEGFYLHHGARRLGERRSVTTKRLLPLLWLPV